MIDEKFAQFKTETKDFVFQSEFSPFENKTKQMKRKEKEEGI